MTADPPKLDLEWLLEVLAERVAAKLSPDLHSRPEVLAPTARLLSVGQAAVYLGRTKGAIQHMISAGVLPVVKADRRVFLDVKDLDGWIESNKQPWSV